MESVFWDARGILFIDYLKKGKTINSDYYMASLDHVSAEIRKKWSHMQKKEVLLHQDNAPYHKFYNGWPPLKRQKEIELIQADPRARDYPRRHRRYSGG